jgi:MinD-like ATPase involved in chromosome partitioning or flagellar assembly
METELAIALSARDWPDRLRRFLADHGGARVRVASMGPEDLLAESYDVLVIDDMCSFLTPRLVEMVNQRGRAVLGVYDPVEFADGKDRLIECGVSDVVESDAEADEFLEAIGRIMSGRGAQPRVEHGVATAEGAVDTGVPAAPSTSVLAVGGPSGGVGATEVAIALAARLATHGSTVLVEVDESAPSLAQRLGIPLFPNLRTAIDVLEHRSGSMDRVVHRVSGASFAVLPGLANVRDWTEVRPRQAVDLIRELALNYTHVVVNVGNRIEAEGFGDGQGRHGVSRAVVQSSDRLVAVGLGTPVGVARLLEWLSIADGLREHRRADVLVNRAPSDQFRRAELLQEVGRTYSPASFGYLPEDPKLVAAGWDGSVAARGRFRKAVNRWTDRFVLGGDD